MKNFMSKLKTKLKGEEGTYVSQGVSDTRYGADTLNMDAGDIEGDGIFEISDADALADAYAMTARNDLPKYDRKLHGPPIVHVAVVGFHHTLGPNLEFLYPPIGGTHQIHDCSDECDGGLSPTCGMRESTEVPAPEWQELLPFMALPDGTHHEEEDHVFFQLPFDGPGGGQLYCVACFQQVDTSGLHKDDEGSTRGKVQKSVVALSRVPFFGAIHARLEAITRTYFSQNDFTSKRILHEAYSSLNSITFETLDHSQLYLSLSPVVLLEALHEGLLSVFKAILLEKRVMFYAPHPAHKSSSAVLSLVSLLPGVLEQVLGENFPGLGKKWFRRSRFGLPLEVFGTRATCQPYLSLEQMDLLQRPQFDGFLIGVSNLMFVRHPKSRLDVLVDLSSGKIEWHSSEVMKQCHLAKVEKHFIKDMIKDVEEAGGSAGCYGWQGSDDWMRSRMETYMENLLSLTAGALVGQSPDGEGEMDPDKLKLCNKKFDSNFMQAWIETDNFKAWARRRGPNVADGVTRRDPPRDGVRKFAFLNGDIYDGAWLDGKRHGEGTYQCVNGDTYTGMWKCDQRYGQGSSTSSQGRVTYTGEWQDDMKCGYGEVVMSNQDRYKGQWKENRFHGKGVFTSANGWFFEGEFSFGQMTGIGTKIMANGTTYKGEFVSGNREGLGQCTFANSAIYNGNWKDDQENGTGTLTCPDGSRYEGEWADGKKSSYGTYVTSAGDKFEGDWEADQMVAGHWSFVYAAGDKYVGDAVDEKRQGTGMCKYKSGHTYDGEWHEDKRHGEGTVYNPDGSRYEGEWADDCKHGYGKLFTASDVADEGWWSRDVRTERKGAASTDEGDMLDIKAPTVTTGLSSSVDQPATHQPLRSLSVVSSINLNSEAGDHHVDPAGHMFTLDTPLSGVQECMDTPMLETPLQTPHIDDLIAAGRLKSASMASGCSGGSDWIEDFNADPGFKTPRKSGDPTALAFAPAEQEDLGAAGMSKVDLNSTTDSLETMLNKALESSPPALTTHERPSAASGASVASAVTPGGIEDWLTDLIENKPAPSASMAAVCEASTTEAAPGAGNDVTAPTLDSNDVTAPTLDSNDVTAPTLDSASAAKDLSDLEELLQM